MILVSNHNRGDLYGFSDLETYKAFARANEGKDRTFWEDNVHDVGAGGQATDENRLDMRAFQDEMIS